MKLIDIREVLRFIVVGGVATLGNVCMVWLIRDQTSFEITLVIGVMTGMAISFLLSKAFAFRSTSWRHAPSELSRFSLVYAVSAGAYWIVSLKVKPLAAVYLDERAAEYAAILFGCGVMAIISYFGHRFFTYRKTSEN